MVCERWLLNVVASFSVKKINDDKGDIINLSVVSFFKLVDYSIWSYQM